MASSYGYATKAGVLLFVGSCQFLIFLVIAETIFPNYSVSNNYISDLGVWSELSATIFNPSIIISGSLTIAAGYFILKRFKKRAFSSFVVLSGIGALTVGIFPEDTFLVNAVPVFHAIGALLAFVFGGLAAISSYRVVKSPFKYLGVVLGVLSLLAMILFLFTGPYDYFGLGAGGMERMITYPTLVWTICLGGHLMAPHSPEAPC